MAFKQGRRPCLVLEKKEHRSFRGALFSLGYQLHDGPRTTRDGEVQAWVGSIRGGRQVHVQEVRRRDGTIAVFAHTEPEGHGLDHLVAAILDRASFSGGAKVLLNDLRAHGWDIQPPSAR
jgi:hypothetical protein